MRQKYTTVVWGVVVLAVGLALGFGGAAVLGRDKGATGGEIHNAQLGVGDKAPDFDLYDSTGAKIRLSDYLGQKNVVLAFYPAAWTPV